MKRGELEVLIAKYMEGDLTTGEAKVILAEVEASDEARRLLARHIYHERTIQNLLAPAPATGLRLKKTVAPRRLPAPRRRRRAWLGWSLAAAALLAVSAGAYFTLVSPEKSEAPFEVFLTAERLSGSMYYKAEGKRGGLTPIPDKTQFGRGVILVTVGGNSRVRVTLSDGTQAELRGDTWASFDSLHDVYLMRGLLRADVVRQPAGRTFVLSTPQGEAAVLGTRLALSATAEGTRLEVERGLVRLTRRADGKSADVAAGQYAVAAPGVELVARDLFRIIRAADYRDKARGAWLGELIGGAWGEACPTPRRLLREEEVVPWSAERINKGFEADDVFVSVSFVEAAKALGLRAGWDAVASRNSAYGIAHGSKVGFDNNRRGLAAFDCGHYSRNPHAEDIDAQVFMDFAGTISPDAPHAAVGLAWNGGHLLDYGDGVYGGVFMAAMRAAAFSARSVEEIVEAGRQAVPAGTKYRQVVEDVLAARVAHGEDWTAAWQLVKGKWENDLRCPERGPYDAKLNGAWVLLGLLYGRGDFERSIRIALRCGQAACCNASAVGGILGTWLGASRIPEGFTQALDPARKFRGTSLTLDGCVDACDGLAREALGLAGGVLEGGLWKAPDVVPLPAPFEQWPTGAKAPPQLSASATPIEGRTLEFAAVATSNDGIQGYQWFFGDLARAEGARAAHTYAEAGTYTAVCWVSDRTGNTAWKAIPVVVK